MTVNGINCRGNKVPVMHTVVHNVHICYECYTGYLTFYTCQFVQCGDRFPELKMQLIAWVFDLA